LYLYLNYGYSWGEFFPRHRAGFEPFLTLPKNWEISLGGRYMMYEPEENISTDVFILTGSVSKYHQIQLVFIPPVLRIYRKYIFAILLFSLPALFQDCQQLSWAEH
jgi:hypothetical protein